MRFGLLLFLELIFLHSIETTLGPSNRKSSIKTAEKPASVTPSSETPTIRVNSPLKSDFNVLQRNLIQEDLTSQSILENHALYCTSCIDIREFSYPTLIYITPWNNRGYDLIKIFAQKFDYVSPVWFNLKRIDTEKYLIEGTHDIDIKWIETIKEKRPDIRFVPRLIIEKWSSNDIETLLHSEDEKQQLALTMKNLLIEYDHLFDGYVLELLAQFQKASKTDIHHVLVDIAGHIHGIETNSTRRKEVILAVPPLETYFNQDDMSILSNYLDGFHIMTYDFPAKPPAPVAPIEWIEEILNRFRFSKADDSPKIFLGINFYGYRYDRILPPPPKDERQYHLRHILGRDYIDFLREYYKKAQIFFDRRAHEHITILYGRAVNEEDKSTPEVVIFYPSLKSIYDRLELANKRQIGVAVWDGGQGLDYFFDLF